MKNILLLLVLFISLSSYAQQQSALQNEENLKYHLKDINNLDSFSNIYFEMGDYEFLIIDAYKDGLARSNDDMRFAYENNVLSFNNSLMQQPYASKYLAKLQRLWVKVQRTAPSRLLLGPGDGIIGEDAFVYSPQNNLANHNSALNVNFDQSVNSYLEHRHNDSLLIHSLYVNHIISNTNMVHIRYSKMAFYVNEIKLENLNLLHDYNMLVEKINNTTPIDENDFFGLYYDKKDVWQFCKD